MEQSNNPGKPSAKESVGSEKLGVDGEMYSTVQYSPVQFISCRKEYEVLHVPELFSWASSTNDM